MRTRKFSHLFPGVLAAFLIFVLFPNAASAQYFDGFEDYAPGESIVGLGDWKIWYTGPGYDPISATVTDAAAKSGTNSLAIGSENDVVQIFSDVYTSGSWTLSAQIYIPSGSTGVGYFSAINTYTDGDPLWDLSTQYTFDVDTDELEVGIYGTSVTTATTAIIYDTWVEVRVNIDLDANTQATYYDGEELVSGAWQMGGKAAIECLDLWSGVFSAEFYYDDVTIAPDCNGNGVDDAIDIAGGASEDCDGDGIPDDCAGSLERILSATVDAPEAFGSALALDDKVLVVGAPLHDPAGGGGSAISDAGGVYVYRSLSGDWESEGTLTASDAGDGDEFGTAVSVSGDWLLIGAPHDDAAASNAGAAYFFQYETATLTWVERQKVMGGGLAASDEFGSAVAIDGEYAVVGAYADDDAGTSSGLAYVFHYDETTGEWSEVTTLHPDALGAGDQLARAVAITGDTIFLGASRDDDTASNAGAVYIYEYDGAEWQESDKLHASDGAGLDNFGNTLAAECGLLVTGATGVDAAAADNTGAVYSFRLAGGTWDEEQIIAPDSLATFDQFGSAVALSGDVLVVGVNYGSGEKPGSVFTYHFDGSNWDAVGVFPNPRGPDLDEFGSAVATNGVVVCGGAPFAVAGSATDGGAVFATTAFDCNGNGTLDACDIGAGTSDDDNGNGIPDECEDSATGADCTISDTPPPDEVKFKRGDCNNNGSVNALSDALFLLQYGFSGGTTPACLTACDTNNNNNVNALSDGLALLQWGFSGGTAPPSPGTSTCGPDPETPTTGGTPGCVTPSAACN